MIAELGFSSADLEEAGDEFGLRLDVSPTDVVNLPGNLTVPQQFDFKPCREP